MNKKVVLSMLVVASLSLTIGCNSEDIETTEDTYTTESVEKVEDEEEIQEQKDNNDYSKNITTYNVDIMSLTMQISEMLNNSDFKNNVWKNELEILLEDMNILLYKVKDLELPYPYIYSDSHELAVEGANRLVFFVKSMEQVLDADTLYQEHQDLLDEALKSYEEGIDLIAESSTKISEEIEAN